MKLLQLTFVLVLLSGCERGADVKQQQIAGRSATSFSYKGSTMTEVDLGNGTSAVFKSAGGIGDIDITCLGCEISKISECAGPGKTSEDINDCAHKKCVDAKQCPKDAKLTVALLPQAPRAAAAKQ